MYTTTEISKGLVDSRLVLMVVAALNSSLENSKEDLWLRCKKSLNVRFGRTKCSCYDYCAEFNIYRRRNIYTFVYKTVWLI